MSTKNSCLEYEKATATWFFPKGEVCCDLCPVLETYSRRQCRLTGEYLAKGYLRGWKCPLIIESEVINFE